MNDLGNSGPQKARPSRSTSQQQIKWDNVRGGMKNELQNMAIMRKCKTFKGQLRINGKRVHSTLQSMKVVEVGVVSWNSWPQPYVILVKSDITFSKI